MGITPHTDPGIVTVLLQNRIKGLQVKHGGEWVEVSPVHGGLIINVGDFLQIVSNGEYKSVQHRMVANSEKEPRISIVMFFNLSKWRGSGTTGLCPSCCRQRGRPSTGTSPRNSSWTTSTARDWIASPSLRRFRFKIESDLDPTIVMGLHYFYTGALYQMCMFFSVFIVFVFHGRFGIWHFPI